MNDHGDYRTKENQQELTGHSKKQPSDNNTYSWPGIFILLATIIVLAQAIILTWPKPTEQNVKESGPSIVMQTTSD